ncbi:helix-turn-helix domain-containing protein [Nocardiopsis sp. FIRDI 009]|uniref:helix-turn-helix domain-containing protein n=1 Tax=Nocardiopsis sp. FIRDI 009 TaxID=714197 RepID=UPI0018E5154F|nr:helix-turn-helix domain-containing protein [Nocardiopsis sp. FIRDI 009]
MRGTGTTVRALTDALDGTVHGLVAAPRGVDVPVRAVVVADTAVPVPPDALMVCPSGGESALTAAAAGPHIHPTTLRHRIRRVGEVTRDDLDGPDQRLPAMISLRL